MTNEEIIELQRREREWGKTPIGAAFQKMTSAVSRAWVIDTESGFRENVSDKRLREAWDAEKAATQEFRARLDEQTKQHVEMLAALKAARQFILNGIEMGFIRLPSSADDPANQTLPTIEAAIVKATGAAS